MSKENLSYLAGDDPVRKMARDTIYQLRSTIEALQADNERLAAALEEIVDFINKEGPAACQWEEITQSCKEAEDALAANRKEGE
jgi:predicted ArsR family transcriptional regulator